MNERVFEEGRRRMLGPLAVWFALTRDKRGLLMVGVLLLLIVVTTLVWNVVP